MLYIKLSLTVSSKIAVLCLSVIIFSNSDLLLFTAKPCLLACLMSFFQSYAKKKDFETLKPLSVVEQFSMSIYFQFIPNWDTAVCRRIFSKSGSENGFWPMCWSKQSLDQWLVPLYITKRNNVFFLWPCKQD